MDLAELTARLQAELFFESLEDLVTNPEGFGLTTATNVQRAACWVIQCNTIPDHLWEDELVRKSFGNIRPKPYTSPTPREILLIAGVRGAKTLICAAACVWFAIKVDLSTGPGKYLKEGEVPRGSLVSALKDNAKEAFKYVKGALENKPRLRPLLIGEPTMDAISLRHPSGRQIDIHIIAMQGEGVSLTSRWSVFVLFDEAPRMSSDDADGKINLTGMVKAVRSRMLPNCPILYIGSPVGAIGYVYKLYEQNFEKEDQRVVVMKAQGPWLNPFYWTPELVEEFKTNPRLADDYKTDVLAEFREVEMQMFAVAVIERAMRRGPVMYSPEEGRTYTSTMDPAGRNNACTLMIGNTNDNIRFRVDTLTQWQGTRSSPLDFNVVFPEVKAFITPYLIASVLSDQWAIDPLRALAANHKLMISSLVITRTNKVAIFKALQTRMNADLIDIPYHEDLKNDLLRVKLVISPDGTPWIKTPETEDGRHCDFALVLAMLCGGHLAESDVDKFMAEKKATPDDPAEAAQDDIPQHVKDWLGFDESEGGSSTWLN